MTDYGCMNQALRAKCEVLTQQRDRQLAEVNRLKAELWKAKADARWTISCLRQDLNTEENRRVEAESRAWAAELRLAMTNAHDTDLREQPF